MTNDLNIKERVVSYRDHYQSAIKPWIEKGHHYLAGMELGNLVYGLENRAKELLSGVNMGLTYVVTMGMLKDELISDEKNELTLELLLERMETLGNQIELPLPELEICYGNPEEQVDIKTMCTEYRNCFNSEILPYIERGEYGIAAHELGNLSHVLNRYPNQILEKVHMGTLYVATMGMLKDELLNEERTAVRLDNLLVRMQAFGNQMDLPL